MYDEVTKTGRPKKRWGGDFWKWLRSVRLEDKASQAALEAAIRAADSAEEQRREFEKKAREIAMESSLGTTILSLTCLKGVSFITALAFCAYVGDFDRIASGRKCTAYFGLAPRVAVASFLAFLVGSFINAAVMSRMKVWSKGRWFVLRAVASTLAGEFCDSMIFFPIALAGIVPWELMPSFVLWQVGLKTMYELIVLPITIRVVRAVKKKENTDVFDTDLWGKLKIKR